MMRKVKYFILPKNIHVAEGLSSDEKFGWRYHRFCTCKKTFNAHKNHAIILIFFTSFLITSSEILFYQKCKISPQKFSMNAHSNFEK